MQKMKPFKIINIFGKYYSEVYKKYVVIANVLNGDGNKILSIHFFFETDFCARRLKVGDEVDGNTVEYKIKRYR